MDLRSCIDELTKLGAISDDEAHASLNQLDKFEANKLTPGQVGRYAVIGGAAAPAVNVLKNAIKGGGRHLVEGISHGQKLRSLAADAAGGAILTGAVPIIRSRFDQHAEVKKLRQYLKEHGETA